MRDPNMSASQLKKAHPHPPVNVSEQTIQRRLQKELHLFPVKLHENYFSWTECAVSDLLLQENTSTGAKNNGIL
ncbi:hypothetical protein Hamer_G026063 [Homarus americanus]|uniref:Uncharacterized protein n=1 Tax=Homarus americanus TaxID=6706 RepID=A0A8J5JFS3_HOMAM|nr:hypothetical protein Hamer_G026063 [Homarus americanus]